MALVDQLQQGCAKLRRDLEVQTRGARLTIVVPFRFATSIYSMVASPS